MAHRALILLALLAAACAGGSVSRQDRAPGTSAPATAKRSLPFPLEDARWGRFQSKRFQLSVPLPDGRSWKIDDHSQPLLIAEHATTSSEVAIAATNEQELVNRQRCEARAHALGFVPERRLTTVDEEVVVFPDAYDSKIWIALDAARPDGAVTGHVFLFGAFLRRCIFVRVTSTVASAADEDVLSTRLAVARARIVGGLKLDPLRTTDDATVPRDRPDIRR